MPRYCGSSKYNKNVVQPVREKIFTIFDIFSQLFVICWSHKILGNMKKNQITKPIKYPNGYLLLKINDKKEMKDVVDIEKELNDLISYERDKQLNQFSLLYYKKLKQNTKISEY